VNVHSRSSAPPTYVPVIFTRHVVFGMKGAFAYVMIELLRKPESSGRHADVIAVLSAFVAELSRSYRHRAKREHARRPPRPKRCTPPEIFGRSTNETVVIE
jgi:hypothetical protein